ncbi:MAG: methylenetetrahydrofolate--tRNA-(uracil(54)-C(5))-methyltransferase (FADH(2)-oxidizing) TrmFO [Desulfovibrio sp.]|nr:methylenetetrahydrofolate--tRNA-(uracil(54)-C(5))-methyltransferase (FADH(2)-oxidizing) TrmFO [Desulfovibrio sp.]
MGRKSFPSFWSCVWFSLEDGFLKSGDSVARSIAIIGAGLAGCECALVLAKAGFHVMLFEQKPEKRSPAHVMDSFAELVCSNSLRSNELTSGVGLLKQEMRDLGSFFMDAADANSVPADKALAVDRTAFSRDISQKIHAHPNISCFSHSVASLDDPLLWQNGCENVIVAAGPLASDELVASLKKVIGETDCYFYDAIAPIVWTSSLQKDIVFRASRYDCEKEDYVPGQETGDYLNCPMTKDEYLVFYEALRTADTVPSRDFETVKHFEGCMPIEALAARGERTLAFGPMKPIGLRDPRTGKRPYAVLQLRFENRAGTTCNLVGCQTRMRIPEQERVFRLVPGLEKAEFARFGSMHRNTYVNAPIVLEADQSLRARPSLFLAGQITGVEGYVESAAQGLWLSYSLIAKEKGIVLPHPPRETALGALLGHLATPSKHFQPSNIHFGLMPPCEEKLRKANRK